MYITEQAALRCCKDNPLYFVLFWANYSFVTVYMCVCVYVCTCVYVFVVFLLFFVSHIL